MQQDMNNIKSQSNNLSLEGEKRVFSVEGVQCANCIKKIKSLEKNFKEWGPIHVDIGRQILTLPSAHSFSSEKFKKEVSKIGFEVRELQQSNEIEVKQTKQNRLFLARLGVAGACAGNIMLIAFALYSGADASPHAALLRWTSFVLYLPVLFFSAYPFFESAYRSIKSLNASIDVPLAVAVLLGGVLSLYNLMFDKQEIYFDSLSVLVFLILSTRYLVFRIQMRHLEPLSITDILNQKKEYKELRSGTDKLISELEPLDIIELYQGESIPVDGILLSDKLEVDNSLITGESLPVFIKKYSAVTSGSRVLSKHIKMQITKKMHESRIHLLVEKINQSLLEKSKLISFTDKASLILTYIVLGLGSIFFTLYSFVDFHEAINRTLALLVIACPCALAIATPLSLSLAIRSAFKKGIIVKNLDSIEKVVKCQTIIFDKTGTLTSNDVSLNEWQPSVPNFQDAKIIVNLELQSEHPFAKAIVRNLMTLYPDLEKNLDQKELTNIQENIGVGVSATFLDTTVKFVKLDTDDSFQSGFYVDNTLKYQVSFSAYAFPGTKDSLQRLKSFGYENYLLTGDSNRSTEKVLDKLGLPMSMVVTDASPEDKAHFVKEKSLKDKIIYVGDGLNDSLAMSNSSVSISTYGSTDATYRISDVHLLNRGVQGVEEFINLSKKTLKTIKRNLLLSFVYNLSFGTIALIGYINPLVAAVLMPLSSVTVVTLSFISFKSVRGEK